MPTFRPAKPPKPIEIDKFLGLNQSIGETEIKLGEAVNQTNFRLTQDYKPQKRSGHKTFVDFDNELACQGGWQGTLNGKNSFIFINNGNVYEYDLDISTETTALADLITEGTVILLGTITDARTSIFWFESKVYFINGTDYKYYDGSTYGDVEGYIPTIAIETPPAGGGTDFEDVNLLTGKKKQNFTGDNTATLYQLRELNIDADLLLITVDGVSLTEGVEFTVNRTNGTVDFSTGSAPLGAPVTDALVVIQWNKASATNVALVKNNRFATDFGPGNDTAIFMWGNENFGNKRMWSGTLDASYWPEFNFTLIGSDEFPITDIAIQYDRQIIFKTNRTYYSYAEYVSALEKYEYPVFDLNEAVGNVAFHAVQIVENNPVSLHKQSWWEWSNTQVEDERNAKNISERIRKSLEDLDLSTAITFDNQKQKELFVNVGSKVYIWNYGIDAFYIFDNIEANWFLDIEGVIYYGANGTVERREGLNDNGVAISANLELGFTDFGVNELVKNSRKLWITIQPYSRTSVDISYATDKTPESAAKTIKTAGFVLFDFTLIDFADFSFESNRNPQPFRRKVRAKKYAYIKFIFNNEEPDEELTILSLKIIAETAGEVK